MIFNRVQTFAFVALFASASFAAEPVIVSAKSNAQRVRVGDEFQIDISVRTFSSAEVKSVKLPSITGFELVRQERGGTRQSTSIVNGVASYERSFSHHLFLKATSAGVHEFGAVRVLAGKEVALSRPFQITVLAEDQKAGRSGFSSALDPALRYEEGEAPDSFYDVRFDRDSAFVGEQVVLILRVYSKEFLDFRNEVKAPKLESFWTEEIESDSRRASERVIGNERYYMYEIGRVAAFPLKAMTFTLRPTQIKARVNSGWRNRRSINLRSDEVTLEVKPLPAKKRPPDFQSANVGEYQLYAEVSPPVTTVGEPVTLKLIAVGEGHVSALSLPSIENAIENARVFPPTTTEKKSMQGGRLQGVKSVQALVQPLEAGVLEIAPFELAYFDAKSKSYKTAKTNRLRVRVKERKGVAARSDEGEVAAGARLIKRNIASRSPTKAPYKSMLFWGFLVLSASLALSLFAFLRLKEKQEHSGKAKKKRARGALQNALNKAIESKDLGEGAHVLRGALSDALNVDLRNASAHEIDEALINANRQSLARMVSDWFAASERAAYAGDKGVSRRALFDTLKTLVDEVQK